VRITRHAIRELGELARQTRDRRPILIDARDLVEDSLGEIGSLVDRVLRRQLCLLSATNVCS